MRRSFFIALASSCLAVLACSSSSSPGPAQEAPDGSPDASPAPRDATGDANDATEDREASDASDGGLDAGTLDCGTPDNPPGCPAVYYPHNQPCMPIGLTCAYPGAGDGLSSTTCGSTAMLWCIGDGGTADTHADAAADGGPGFWLSAQ